MRKKILWITETAAMLALLIALQSITKPLGQLVTGSCVNAILAISTFISGLTCGVTIAVCSPVLAFLLGIAPQILTVPVIMIGNTIYVVLLHLLKDPNTRWSVKQILCCVLASVCKFFVLHTLVAKIICGVLSEYLLASGTLKTPMLTALPATFSWPQLITALLGSIIALIVVPVLNKALHR